MRSQITVIIQSSYTSKFVFVQKKKYYWKSNQNNSSLKYIFLRIPKVTMFWEEVLRYIDLGHKVWSKVQYFQIRTFF